MSEQRKLVHEELIQPGDGWAGTLEKGQHVRFVDVEGEQVGDLVFFNADNIKECISTGITRSRQFLGRPGAPYRLVHRVTEGDVIFSSAYRPMATIVADTPPIKGIHELDLHMCNNALYKHLGYPDREGCWEITSRVVAKYGIAPEQIPDPLNIFLNAEHDPKTATFTILRPISRPGDYIEFRLEMDCIVAIPVCPMDVGAPVNGDKPTPLKVEVYDTLPQ
jgi:uncharacterized protein YcgI (DUF1989 family)